MEKMIWTRPIAEVEQFMPNEYIAACGELSEPVYKFACNAGGGVPGGAWRESNGIEGLQSEAKWSGIPYLSELIYSADSRITNTNSSFSACPETHEVPTQDSDEFIQNCYYKAAGQPDSSAIPVLVWRGKRGDNVHCCTGLTDIGSLPIIKS